MELLLRVLQLGGRVGSAGGVGAGLQLLHDLRCVRAGFQLRRASSAWSAARMARVKKCGMRRGRLTGGAPRSAHRGPEGQHRVGARASASTATLCWCAVLASSMSDCSRDWRRRYRDTASPHTARGVGASNPAPSARMAGGIGTCVVGGLGRPAESRPPELPRPMAAPTSAARVAAHYSTGGVLRAIVDGLARLGKTPANATLRDLEPADHFHIGGRDSALALFAELGLRAEESTTADKARGSPRSGGSARTLLDIGCGLGGPARLAASTFGCHVRGIDLTQEYVHVGNAIRCDYVAHGCIRAAPDRLLARRSCWEGVGLSEHVTLEVADATRMECVFDGSVDAVSMIHVGMNVADKRALAREVARVL